MRKIWVVAKAFFIVLSSLGCAAFALFLAHAPAFEIGQGYELYCGASSSALVVRTDNPACDKILLGGVKGESVRYRGDCARELISRYRADVLFTEEAGGVTNYYCHSPLFGAGVAIGGYVVNLHLAVGEEQTAAGMPLIFGGF